jgi:hypothetical protein
MSEQAEQNSGDQAAGGKPAGSPDTTKLAVEMKAREERIAKLESEKKERDDAEKKAEETKAIANGKAKELLAAKEKELNETSERLKALEAREAALADDLLSKLPDTEKAAAKILRAKLSPADFVDYLRAKPAAQDQAVDNEIAAPPSGTAGRAGGRSPTRKLHPDTHETLGRLYANDTAYRVGQHLDLQDGKFTLGKKREIAMLRNRHSVLGGNRELSLEQTDKLLRPND